MAIELKKGQKVNLEKAQGTSLGEVCVNLNWNQTQKKGFFVKNKSIDLDLGCLYELKNGRKGCVQALGKAFGSLQNEPYIMLDGDDRTGNNTEGENLRINGVKISEIKRILVYTYIYEGAVNWKDTQGVVTVKVPGSSDIIVKMDEYGSNDYMCAIAMIENVNDENFSVEKIVNFYKGHKPMDLAYGWNMNWTSGRK